MASAGRVQALLTCAKAQERRAMLPDGFSVGYFRLGTRLETTRPFYVTRKRVGSGHETTPGPAGPMPARRVSSPRTMVTSTVVEGIGSGVRGGDKRGRGTEDPLGT